MYIHKNHCKFFRRLEKSQIFCARKFVYFNNKAKEKRISKKKYIKRFKTLNRKMMNLKTK